MQVVNLQIAPTGINPIIHMSQSDVGRQFQLRLYDGAVAYILPSGTTARIDGIKTDGEGFSYADAVAISGNTVTVTTKTQMTTTPGDVECEIRLVNGTEDIGTLNFIMAVEESPLSNVDISKTDLPEIIEEVKAAAESATTSAEVASTSATTASNAATSASTSASNADTNALKSEGYATGKQNGSDVPSGSDYYHNNARYYAEIARFLSANPPYIGDNGNWYVWSTNTGAYVDSGIDASITVTIADITMLATNENPYVTNTGTDTDPIFHLFIPRGAGIQSIAKTSTSGLVDTYTITFTDGQTTTYTVTNGAKGDTGDSAGFGTPTASIDGNVGTPSVAVTATGPDTAKVFNFAFSNLKGETGERGPQGVTGDTGVGIVSITKTATQGLVDTYTILLTNDQTYTFTVTNGQNGTGVGDMLSTDYDPTQAVYNAGGIVAYVASQISGLSTSLSGLTDVALTSLAAGQSLFYDATAQKWVNKRIDYSDIQNTPTLGTAAAKNSTNAVTPNSTDLVESGAVSAKIQTLTNNLEDEIETRAKLTAYNLLQYPYWNYPTVEIKDSVTNTTNSDGSMTISGTPSQSGNFNPVLFSRTPVSGKKGFYLKKGTYIIKMFDESDSEHFYMYLATTVNGAYSGLASTFNTTANEVELTIDDNTNSDYKLADGSVLINVYLYANYTSGIEINKTLHPVICLKSDLSKKFFPYAMTNRELTEALNGNYILAGYNIFVSEYSDGTKTIKNLLDALYTDISNIISGLANDEIICVQFIDGTFGRQCPTTRRYYAKGDTFSETYFSIYTTSGPLVRTFHIQLSTTTNASKSEFSGASPSLSVTSLNSDIVPNNSRLYFAYEKYKKIG